MRNIMKIVIAVTAFSGLLTWVDALRCPALTKSNATSGYINYNDYEYRPCTWPLPQPTAGDHILVLKLLKLSLMNGNSRRGYLKIPGIPEFSETKIKCLIFAAIPSFDAEQTYAALNSSLRPSCGGHTWILREKLPEEINLAMKYAQWVSFRIDYDYISFGAIDITETTTSATTTSATTTSAETTSASDYSTLSDIGAESHSNASTIHFGVFAAVVSVLAVLLILCALAIVWMQRRHKKLRLTSNALRGSIRAATRIQASTIQRVEERQQPSEPNGHGAVNIGYNSPQTYAEIAGCSTAVSGSSDRPESQYHQVSYVNQRGQSRQDDFENATYAEAGNPEPQQVNYDSQMNANQEEMESEESLSAQYAVLNKKSRVVQR